MAQLELLKDEIGQAGAELVYIAAEKATGVWKPAKFLQSHPVAYPFLLDEDRSVTKAYGLSHRISLDALNIAHPATFVIERDRKVAYIYRGDCQTDRSPFEQALESVKRILVSG
jgi:peroxiredoxin